MSLALALAVVGAGMGCCVLILARRSVAAKVFVPTHRWILGTAAVGAVALASLGWFTDASLSVVVVHGMLLGALLGVSLIDIADLRVPNRIVYPVVLISLTIMAAADAGLTATSGRTLGRAVVGACVFAGLLGVLHLARPTGMGLGDVKLAVLLGLYLGWSSDHWLTSLVLVGWAVLLAALLGLASAALSTVSRRRSQSTPSSSPRLIPFAPSLSMATWLVVVAAASGLN